MQIESRLSGYGYSAKPYPQDRKVEDNTPTTSQSRRYHDGALTGSSTLLSSSLANALWAVEGDRQDTIDTPTSSAIAQVEDVYSEF